MPISFISYRWKDSADFTEKLYMRLVGEFAPSQVFRDKQRIYPGDIIDEVVRLAINQCEILIVVIGTEWLDIKDENGNRRLENPKDLVRFEVATGLARGIPVIPILINTASIPAEDLLPDELKPLRRNNYLFHEIRAAEFEADMNRLLKAVTRALPLDERVMDAFMQGQVTYDQVASLGLVAESDREDTFDEMLQNAPTAESIEAEKNIREAKWANKLNEIVTILVSHQNLALKVGCVIVVRQKLDVRLELSCPMNISRISVWTLFLTRGWGVEGEKYTKFYPSMDDRFDKQCRSQLTEVASQILEANENLGATIDELSLEVLDS